MSLDFSLDIESFWILELALVQIGCCPNEQDPCVLGNRLTVQLKVAPRTTGQRLRRRLEAKHLLNRIGNSTGLAGK